jgi:hypothetical protein
MGEDDLPDYDHSDAPARLPDYEERHLLEPVVSYNIYQITRKLQVLTPATRASFGRPRYRLMARSVPSVFSKKADFTLTRLPTGAAAAAERSPGKEVGFINFDRTTQIPWMPRATVQFASNSNISGRGKLSAYDLCSPNFSDWKFHINGLLYFWQLTDKPMALSLIEDSSDSIIARFTYSVHGTAAQNGAELGTLDIFGGSRSGDVEMIELVLCTCQVAIHHWKNMGKHFRNEAEPRGFSVSGPLVPRNNGLWERSGSRDGPRRTSNVV